MSTDGTLTESGRSPVTTLQAITSGPDGALWLTDSDNYHIQRVTPAGIALGSAGNIYVTNYSNGPGTITVYAAGASGNVMPTATIAGSNTGLDGPRGIALDDAGNIYVANYFGDSITVYAAGASGNARPMATIAGSNTGLNYPFGIALPLLSTCPSSCTTRAGK